MIRRRLTGRGYLFVGICAALYLSALTSQSGLLLLLIGLALGCGAVNAATAARSVRAIRIIPPERSQVSEGERLREPWQIVNDLPVPAQLVTIRHNKEALFRIPAIPGQGKITAAPSLQFKRRGVYQMEQLQLASAHPFGLVEARRNAPAAAEILVHPAIYPAPVPPVAAHDAIVGGKQRGNRRSMSGSNFAGVRGMQAGDPLRNVHWPASSKGLGLMVKLFDEELSGRVCFVVDTGHAGAVQVADDCVRAAGSMMFATLDAGHHVQWIDLSSGRLNKIPPFADGQELLNQLARAPVGTGCLDAPHLDAALNQIGRNTAVCLVVTAISEPVRAAVGMLLAQRKVVSVCAPRDPGNRVTGVKVFNYTAAEIDEVAE